jgi:hypothetical protein
MRRVMVLAPLLLLGCSELTGEADRLRAERTMREAWEGPCADTSWLLATTAGSPDHATCPNKHQRMRVQVATHPSNEEAAALVFCECDRTDNADR